MRLSVAIAAASLLACAKGAQQPAQLPAQLVYLAQEGTLQVVYGYLAEDVAGPRLFVVEPAGEIRSLTNGGSMPAAILE